jgi:hypothetical protein
VKTLIWPQGFWIASAPLLLFGGWVMLANYIIAFRMVILRGWLKRDMRFESLVPFFGSLILVAGIAMMPGALGVTARRYWWLPLAADFTWLMMPWLVWGLGADRVFRRASARRRSP